MIFSISLNLLLAKTKKECTTGQGTYIIVCLEITANYGLALNRPLGFSLSIKSSCPREIKDMTREVKRTYNPLQLLQSKVCYKIWIPRNVILNLFKKSQIQYVGIFFLHLIFFLQLFFSANHIDSLNQFCSILLFCIVLYCVDIGAYLLIPMLLTF